MFQLILLVTDRLVKFSISKSNCITSALPSTSLRVHGMRYMNQPFPPNMSVQHDYFPLMKWDLCGLTPRRCFVEDMCHVDMGKVVLFVLNHLNPFSKNIFTTLQRISTATKSPGLRQCFSPSFGFIEWLVLSNSFAMNSQVCSTQWTVSSVSDFNTRSSEQICKYGHYLRTRLFSHPINYHPCRKKRQGL